MKAYDPLFDRHVPIRQWILDARLVGGAESGEETWVAVRSAKKVAERLRLGGDTRNYIFFHTGSRFLSAYMVARANESDEEFERLSIKAGLTRGWIATLAARQPEGLVGSVLFEAGRFDERLFKSCLGTMGL